VVNTECAVQTGCPRTYNDPAVPAGSVYYRVMANNTVGAGDGKLDAPRNADGSYSAYLPAELSSLTPLFAGYDNVTANSNWSSIAALVPVASVLPGSITFTATNFGATNPTTAAGQKVVTISNTGKAPLNITGIGLTGPFARGTSGTISNALYRGSCPTTATFNLAAGASCTYNVTFSPTAALCNNTTSCSGVLTVTDNTNNVAGSTQIIPLSGTGAWVAPTVPAGLSASSVTQTALTLNWTAAPTAQTYTVQQSPNGTTWTTIKTGDTTNSLAVTGLAANTRYYYHVLAVNPVGTSAYSASFNAYTLSNAPGTPTATAITAGGLTLNWTAPTSATGVTYTVQRATDAAFTANVVNSASIAGLTTNVTSLAGNTTYYFRVFANNTGNTGVNGAPSASVNPKTGVPSAPTAVAAANGTTGGTITAGLSWTASAGAASYSVRYANTAAAISTGTIVNNATSNVQINVGGAARTVYMQVQAVYTGGTTAWTPATPVAVTAR